MYINAILDRFELELANKRNHVTTFRILSPFCLNIVSPTEYGFVGKTIKWFKAVIF